MKNKIAYIGVAIIVLIVVLLSFKGRIIGDSDSVCIFCIAPLTGPGSAHGENISNAINIYKKNNSDSRLKFEIVDSQSNPQTALSLYRQKMLLQRPDVIVSVLSGITQVLLPETKKDGLPLFAIHTNIQKEFGEYENAQKLTDNFADVSRPLAKFARVKDLKRVAMLFSNEEYGIGCKNVFLQEFQDHSHEVPLVESYEMTGTVSRDLIYKILNVKPDGVFVAGYGPNYIFILKTLIANKYSGMILSDINCSNSAVMNSLGDLSLISNLYFTGMEINLGTPSGKALDFLRQYKTEFNKRPWEGAVYTYDLCSILETLNKEGKALTRKSFTELQHWDGLSDPIDFPGDGTSSYAFFVIKLVDGVPVAAE